ncbi:MAG: hypothetical protein KAW56_01575 [Candidatus Marinimicrobia bacterium]|nr:hypothetical protein [Candidatus Neomarinimicrobiota bacterium]
MINDEIIEHFKKIKQDEKKRQKLYGKVKPIIQTTAKGYKFVAVGNELFYSKKWKTFPDFLMDYLLFVFGKDWFDDELIKNNVSRHPVMQWRYSISEFQKYRNKSKNGLYNAVPSGPFKAFITLAYDLYLLKHHSKLQENLIKRLKNVDQFQGARYELFVITTLIRLGFNIHFEDETDIRRKHVELIAEHKTYGDKIAIEAKSKHRPGILGQPGTALNTDEIRVRLGSLVNSAISKKPGIPYFIFIDLNLPPDKMTVFNDDPQIKELFKSIMTVEVSPEGMDYFNMILYTNFPYHYGDKIEKYPEDHLSVAISQKPLYPLKNISIIQDIQIAIKNYGQIPNQFQE